MRGFLSTIFNLPILKPQNQLRYFEWSPPWHVGWRLSGAGCHWENDRKNGEILSDISFGILSDISSDIFSDISFDILSDISSGISSDILSDISFGILSGISFDRSFDILSDISFDTLSDISSDISFWHFFWHIFWHSFWHIVWHSFWHIFWHSFWHISRLRSGAEHWSHRIAVEARPGTLISRDRGWGPTHHIEHTWSQENPARHTEHTWSQERDEEVEEDWDAEEEEEARRRKRRRRRRRRRTSADIKSNNPHLTGGEKPRTHPWDWSGIFTYIYIYIVDVFLW